MYRTGVQNMQLLNWKEIDIQMWDLLDWVERHSLHRLLEVNILSPKTGKKGSRWVKANYGVSYQITTQAKLWFVKPFNLLSYVILDTMNILEITFVKVVSNIYLPFLTKTFSLAINYLPFFYLSWKKYF